MHRLQNFLFTNVLPPLLALSESKEDTRAAMLRSQLAESFLWLHLGVELGSFPEEASEELFRTYFVPWFNSLLSREEGKRQSMRDRSLYVAHSPESEALILTFPRFASILIEQAMRGENIFLTERNNFRNPNLLSSVFQSLLILTSNFSANPAIEHFILMVNFVDLQTWERQWTADVGAEEELISKEHVVRGLSSPLCVGFVELWRYATRLRELFDDLAGRVEIARSDRFNLRQRAREIQSWNLNLRSAETASRFDQVRRKVMQEIEKELLPYRNDGSAVSIQESIDDAFQFWFSAAPALEPA
jgi:hypothetical protein